MRLLPQVSLGGIELFCLCAESASFSEAASKASLSPPAVSRAIARLEKRLGVKLFQRSTRQVGLTDAGRRYYDQCQQAIDQLVEAEREIAGQQAAPSGMVRISIPTPFGQLVLLPRLAEFQVAYPEIELLVHMNNRNIDFVAEGFDLAVRMRPPPDSELVARPLMNTRQLVVASPEYLQRAGEPTSLDDLQQHNCIQFVPPSSGTVRSWTFLRNGKPCDIAIRGSVSVMEDPLGCATLARNHCGLLQTYSFVVGDDLRSGRLQEVLHRFAGREWPVSLLYRKNQYIPFRVRTLIDFLLDEHWL